MSWRRLLGESGAAKSSSTARGDSGVSGGGGGGGGDSGVSGGRGGGGGGSGDSGVSGGRGGGGGGGEIAGIVALLPGQVIATLYGPEEPAQPSIMSLWQPTSKNPVRTVCSPQSPQSSQPKISRERSCVHTWLGLGLESGSGSGLGIGLGLG